MFRRDRASTELRLSTLRNEQAKLRTRLEEARRGFGTAVADAEPLSARRISAAVARDESRMRELEAAIPTLEERLVEFDREEAEKAKAERRRVHDEARARRARAAAKVDDAFRALEAAHVEYADTTGLDPDYRHTAAIGRRGDLMRAFACLAPTVWEAAAGRYVDREHAKPLAEQQR